MLKSGVRGQGSVRGSGEGRFPFLAGYPNVNKPLAFLSSLLTMLVIQPVDSSLKKKGMSAFFIFGSIIHPHVRNHNHFSPNC